MKMKITVNKMRLRDIPNLAKNLREEDAHEMSCMGFCAKQALRTWFGGSIYSKIVRINGEIVAAFGLEGTFLGETGHPWLLTTKKVEEYPLEFAFFYRQEVRKMLKSHPRLENYCIASYKKSLRVLKLIGFNIDEPKPLVAGGEPFCRFWMEA